MDGYENILFVLLQPLCSVIFLGMFLRYPFNING